MSYANLNSINLFQCPHCDKKIQRKKVLSRSHKVCAWRKKKYQCPSCTTHCTSRGNLKRIHLALKHAALLEMEPKLAEKVVGTNYVPEPTGTFECDICAKLLKRNENLLSHKQRTLICLLVVICTCDF